MSTAVPESTTAPDTRTSHGSGDHDLFAHYAHKRDIERAILDGVPCTALCGKKWLPSRDPNRYPVCPTCKEILDAVWPAPEDPSSS